MAGVRSTFHWNGTDLPEELHDLPSGTYVVEAVDEPPLLTEDLLTEDEDAGLSAALASLRAGKGRSLEQVRQTIDAILRR